MYCIMVEISYLLKLHTQLNRVHPAITATHTMTCRYVSRASTFVANRVGGNISRAGKVFAEATLCARYGEEYSI